MDYIYTLSLIATFVTIIGLPLTLVGLYWSYNGVKDAKKASEEAKIAAENAQLAARSAISAIKRRTSIVDIRAVIEQVVSIEDVQRRRSWREALYKYDFLHGKLSDIESTVYGLSDDGNIAMNEVILEIASIKRRIEKEIDGSNIEQVSVSEMNEKLNLQVNTLRRVLVELVGYDNDSIE